MDVLINDQNARAIVAILTMDDPVRGFRGNRNNFADLAQTGEEMGVLVYVTTPGDLRLMNRKILAYTYQADTDSWTHQWVPLPQVVYNRIPYRNDEMIPEVQQKIQEILRHPQIRLFNPSFFNKWDLFEWLKKSRLTKGYIPSTRKLGGSADLQGLLKLYPLIYLKPERGKAGSGIMRVKRHFSKQPSYLLSIQNDKKSMTYEFANISKLWTKIHGMIGSEQYIAQQGILLARNKKRPYDLRVLVQKNRRGQWGLTGIGARVAGSLSITTHVPRGGSIDDPERLLVTTFGLSFAKKILAKAKKAALAIARQIEKGAGHPLGEMSMDLGVDINGHLWFFEANAKPMKFDEPHIRKRSLESILHYSLYLTKSKKAKTGGASIAR